jgi:Arc/MetJ family transcription regulator
MKNALKRKNVYLDEGKIRKAQRILGTQTEEETIDKALDLVVFRKEILRSLEQTAGKGWGGKKAQDGQTPD